MIKQRSTMRLFFSVLLLAAVSATAQPFLSADQKTEEASGDYKVNVNAKPVFVYQARVSAMPVNVWPGVNRPLEQTEVAAFCYFDAGKKTTVTIQSTAAVKAVVIRPLSLNIRPKINGNTISFEIAGNTQLVVEVNGWHKALHLFANGTSKTTVDKNDRKVLYFGPGIHKPGVIFAKSDQTIYIDEGAVVHGIIYADHIKNLKITGRGILDASTFKRGVDTINLIKISHCQNVTVEGIVMRDAQIWTLMAYESKNISIDNVKIIGMWRYNSDGIDLVNCSQVTVKNSFVRAFDDCIVIKGLKLTEPVSSPTNPALRESNISGIAVSNCVIWNDWGRALEIGAETVADSISDISFVNCDIIHYVHIALDIQNGNRAHVSNIMFDNIRIEDPITENVYLDDLKDPVRDLKRLRDNPGDTYKFKEEEIGRLFEINIKENGWAKDIGLGTVDNVLFKDIQFNGVNYSPKSFFLGYSEEHQVTNIRFRNLVIKGTKITSLPKADFSANEFVKNLVFE